MSVGLSLIMFMACGSAPETAAGGVLSGDAFELNIRPAYLDSQAEMLGEITDLNVIVSDDTGWSKTVQLIHQGNAVYTQENFPPLDNATLTLLGLNDGGVVFHGRSLPISVDEGEHTVSIFVARGGEPVRIPSLPEPTLMGSMVSVGSGRFFTFGGTTSGLQTGETTNSVNAYDLHAMAEGSDAARRLAVGLPTPPGSSGRIGHTATLLTGSSTDAGKVLIAGGSGQYLDDDGTLTGQSTASSETTLFNTDTLEFEDTAALNHARMGHTATSLPNGKVVVVGGFAQQSADVSVVSFVEVYDPTEGVWEVPEEPFQGGGLFHTAARLGTAGVLSCGGIDSAMSFSDECLLITANGAIQVADDLASPLIHASMTTLTDGRVLLTGGLDPSGRPFTGSFDMDIEATDQAWLYDDGTWRALPSMKQKRAMHSTSVLPGGRVIIAGGVSEVSASSPRGDAAYSGLLFDTADAIACVEVFDPDSETFTKLDSCTESTTSSTLAERTALPEMATDPFFGSLLAGGASAEDGQPIDNAILFYPTYANLD